MKRCITIAVCLVFAGCAEIREERVNHEHPLFSAPRNVEQAVVSDNTLKLGVALSGGGLRSSVFSIGVLKALYDMQLLEKVDVYSFVSGGGYAGYWLLSTEKEGKARHVKDSADRPFGYYAFDNSRFKVNMCELMTKSNFVGYGNILKRVVGNGTSFPVEYQRSIERTFGWYYDQSINTVVPLDGMYSNGKRDSRLISDFTPDLNQDGRSVKFPYFIYSMSVLKPKAQYGLTDGNLEMTPIHYGNDQFGFATWAGKTFLPLSQVATISGAAVALNKMESIHLLDQTVPVEFEADKTYLADTRKSESVATSNVPEELKLSDGGHSENLAILPLLRRNVKTIIAVDAEDDKNQIFEGYYKLKDRLSQWGYLVSEPVLVERKVKKGEKHVRNLAGKRIRIKKKAKWWERELTPVMKNAVFTVIVHKEGETHDNDTTIHYIKMNRSDESVYKELYTRWRSPGLKADYESKENETEHARIREFLDITKKPSGDWNCPALAATEFSGVKWAKEDAIIRIANDFDGDFPTRSTFDQSYYIDQTASYIGLGYILGSEIKLSNMQQ